jgi:hypothetical protein
LPISLGPSLGDQITLVTARPLFDSLTQAGQPVKSIDCALFLGVSWSLFRMLTDDCTHDVRGAPLLLVRNLDQCLVLR